VDNDSKIKEYDAQRESKRGDTSQFDSYAKMHKMRQG